MKEWVDGWSDIENVFDDRKNGNWASLWLMLPVFGIQMCEKIYEDEEYLRWVRTAKVDLLILDALANDCGYGMAQYWDAKVILFNTGSTFGYFTEDYGLPDESSWLPNTETSFPVELSFKHRLMNALIPVAWTYYRKWKFFPALEEVTQENLGITSNFDELERNTSLVFINTHFAEDFPRSLPPNVIPIGGIAFTGKTKPLPQVKFFDFNH